MSTDNEPKVRDPNFRTSEQELVASICRESFFEFIKEFWEAVVPELPVWNWHIKYLCDEAQELAERVFAGQPKKHDMVVNVSPGSTKSLIWSVFLPAWIWTRMPSAKFLGVSYAHVLSQDLSRKSRDVVKNDKYKACFPYIEIRDDQDTKAYFQNTHGGVRYSAGVDGTVTGFHFHFIVIDDPLNPRQSLSPADLKAANEWIKSTLSSRKVDRRISVTVLVMQRLTQDDPTAEFLKKKKVKHICLPAEIAPNIQPPELRKYYRDGLMDPVRLGWDELEEAQENGSYHYSGQYLQTPVPFAGGMFKVNRIKVGISPSSRWKRIVRFWDKAGTAGGGAFTVGVRMGVDNDGRIWVLDVIRDQWDSYEREETIRRTAYEDGYATVIGIEQEPGSGGKESAENSVRMLIGFRVRLVKVDRTSGSKERRADPFSHQVNAGNVYLDRKGESTWHQAYLEELKYFPASKYKDQVDASSGAFNLMFGMCRRVGAF